MTSVANLWTSVKLPGYTFAEGIYQGVRTTVYRAIETVAQRSVVIKILDQEYPSFRDLVQFRNQYTVAKHLPIEGIVRPIRLENWGNGYALVMEDFGGVDLGRYIQRHTLNLADTLNIAVQLAAVLHNLHQHQVMHKDIKPANILIHPVSKQIKLIDFSLASLLPKETQIVQAPLSLEGTLAYLAPEQTGRMNRGIDYRSDFYALGVTLYQLLTRQLPFTSQDPLELLHCHMSQVPAAADQVDATIPATVAEIVAKLMAKNAEDRYQSAFGLRYDLERCLSQWQNRGEISPFTLGQRDLCDRFAIPEKLYGRKAEVETLLTAFERVSSGASELMLVAGRKAKLARAYGAAVDYCQHGIDLLGCDRWEGSSDLTLNLYNTAAEAACLHSDYVSMNRWIAEILEHVPDLLAQIPAYEVKIQAEIAQNQLQEAVQTGLGVLENLGIRLPARPTAADIEQGFAATAAQMADKQPDDLLALAEMTTADKLAALRMLAGIWGAAFAIAPALMPLIVLEMVNLSILYGNAPISAFAYVLYGVLLCGAESFQQGYEFGEVALKLLARFNTQTFKAKILFLIGTHITIWHGSAEAALPTLERAYQAGIETGDLEFAALPAAIYSYYAYLTDRHLSDVKQDFVAYTQAVEKIKQTYYLNFLQIWHQAVTNLQGETDQPHRLMGDICDSEVMLGQFEQNNVTTPMAYIYVNRLMLNYLFGHETKAVKITPLADEYAQMVPATLLIPIVNFYGSLAKLVCYPQVSDVQQSEWLENVYKNQNKLQHWSTSAPENYQHKYDLVAAELYRVIGQKLDAMEKYDSAIAGAKANAYIQEEALANELAARFYLSWGKEKVAAGYMQEAYYCYSRWGAGAKLADLKKRYPKLLRPILQPSTASDVLNPLMTIAAPTGSNYPSVTQDSSRDLNQTLDFASILKASQALSRTIHLDELLYQLTRIILQNSGGNCCALLLPNTAGEWYVRAFSVVDDTQLCNDPLANNPNLPVKLIQYVKNTQKSVVINDSETVLPVVDDYLKQNTSKSLLCLPFFNQGKLVGILYLKNRLASGVFTRERILILDVLATQAAIALENARLYQDSQQALQTIQQQEARYRGIFEALSDGLAVVNLETTQVVAANPAYCQMHGYTYEELLALKPAQILRPHAYDKFESFLEAIKQGREFFCDAVCTSKDGTSFKAEIHSVPFQYKGQLCGLTVFRDVTQQRQLELALTQKKSGLRTNPHAATANAATAGPKRKNVGSG